MLPRDVHLTFYGFAIFTVLRRNTAKLEVLADVNSKMGMFLYITLTGPKPAQNHKITVKCITN